jgi:hypothetical protein
MTSSHVIPCNATRRLNEDRPAWSIKRRDHRSEFQWLSFSVDENTYLWWTWWMHPEHRVRNCPVQIANNPWMAWKWFGMPQSLIDTTITRKLMTVSFRIQQNSILLSRNQISYDTRQFWDVWRKWCINHTEHQYEYYHVYLRLSDFWMFLHLSSVYIFFHLIHFDFIYHS